MSAMAILLEEETRRIADLYEAAGREETLLGAGIVRIDPPSRCGRCQVEAYAVFFRSRGWVCTWCEGSRGEVLGGNAADG
jgi:hypothetical protein